ncbi:sigma-E processing peptidase SpoIIGA, partial [uncultured Duncaniella sp.]|uniref:sigma-E processing peptidase SpoIIGA n=1 Tax=uncultured Duncaniella sp. TaxID=2768039 RepID=UPI00345BCAE8
MKIQKSGRDIYSNNEWIYLFRTCLLVFWAYKPACIRQFLKQLVNFILMSALTAGMLFMLKGIFSRGGESSQKFSLLFLLVSVFLLYILFRFLRTSIAKQELRRESMVNV